MPSRTGKKSPRSKQQMKLMYAAAKGGVKGVSREVAKEYVRGNRGKSMDRLPKKVSKRRSSR